MTATTTEIIIIGAIYLVNAIVIINFFILTSIKEWGGEGELSICLKEAVFLLAALILAPVSLFVLTVYFLSEKVDWDKPLFTIKGKKNDLES